MDLRHGVMAVTSDENGAFTAWRLESFESQMNHPARNAHRLSSTSNRMKERQPKTKFFLLIVLFVELKYNFQFK